MLPACNWWLLQISPKNTQPSVIVPTAMNWGMIPFQMKGEPDMSEVGDYIYVQGIRAALDGDMKDIKAYVIGDEVKELSLYVADMTEDEKKIVKSGCLINYNRSRK